MPSDGTRSATSTPTHDIHTAAAAAAAEPGVEDPYEDSLQAPESFYDAQDAQYPEKLQFGPWYWFHSAGDRSVPKTRILPSVAAILMPITVLFVLTSVEANWEQAAPGFDGLRVRKGGGYVAGNGIATALAFMSALTIFARSTEPLRRYFSLRTAMAGQVLINLVLGAVCIVTGAVFQRNRLNGREAWITPEYPCIYVGACLAFLQAGLLIADYLTTRNFNQRGHGFGGGAMQGAIFLANLVAIWTGFGSMVFSSVESRTNWHAYNSCFNAWVLLITTGATVLDFRTVNSKVFIFFWLPVGLLLMFVYFWCFGFGFVQRFDDKPLRRIHEHEDRLRAAYRDLRRPEVRTDRVRARHAGAHIDKLQQRLAALEAQRLRYFCVLFAVGVLLKVCSWLLASLIFTRTEPGWSYWDSVFFLFLTLLTVGVQGMVPSSSTGMPMYHAYTNLDILCTAALDALLLHIVWNLVPWPRYIAFGRSLLASVQAKVMPSRFAHHGSSLRESESTVEDVHAESVTPSAPKYDIFATRRTADDLEDAANVAARLRALLVENHASDADLREYDQLIEGVETRIDQMIIHEHDR
ncbi:hypothetical protein GGF46_000827 [Coemansia sp. RSA 552]|nr:hypothetical protein GGF46_000827 [Coemansia sp. RSA 552]